MDRETFDQNLIDYLDGELPAALREAMDQQLADDSELARVVRELRTTLDVAQLPLEAPSDSLEARILEAIDESVTSRSAWQRLIQSMSWAGSMAMRPQLAMAALLVLVLGSSVLLLRTRPGTLPASASKDPAAQAPAKASPNSLAPADSKVARKDAQGAQRQPASEGKADDKLNSPAASRAFKRAIANYQRGNYEEAQREFALVRASNSINAGQAALYEARTVRSLKGCSEAVAVFSGVRKKYKLKGVGADAAYEEADCHHKLGQLRRWRRLLVALSEHPRYGTRAVAELNDAKGGKSEVATLAKRSRARKPAAAVEKASGKAKRAKAQSANAQSAKGKASVKAKPNPAAASGKKQPGQAF